MDEILFDFLTDNSSEARDDGSEVFPGAVYISCSLIEENSYKSWKGAEPVLVGSERWRGHAWESFEISSYYFSVNFIAFREHEMSLSELLDAVRGYDSDIKSFRSSFDEEGIKRETEISGGFHTYYDGSFFTDEAGEGEGIFSKGSETIMDIGIFSVGSHFSSLIVHEACFKPCITNIDTHKRGFTHETSYGLNFKSLVASPFSFSCSWHIQNEGLPDSLALCFIPFINIRPKISWI